MVLVVLIVLPVFVVLVVLVAVVIVSSGWCVVFHGFGINAGRNSSELDIKVGSSLN